MKETPISVLCSKINFYRSFIERLKTKDGIDKNVPQKKLNKLILEYKQKIKEFESAIKILDPNFKCEQPPPNVFSDEIIELSRKIIPALILGKSGVFQ
jgi:hypothetical protein